MDDECAAMVDAALVAVTNGQGIYPEAASWADPDHVQAAQFMRRMVDDDVWRNLLVERAHARISTQPSYADFGKAYANTLSAQPNASEPFFAGLDAVRLSRLAFYQRWWRRVRGAEIEHGSGWPDSARH
jgi:hypothetical protein